ncbi:NAD-dependent succinate-semialdehyde dehydrogenase [Nitriliruptor alkaliphilus]|uniref:NAD-dependent succinate-semialdehyde dehydrogenase n=1 Tax=Nitriliruptor alkaliphilus TaxID=427918 RepID=UPI000B26C758|nr:NAD-dependent succinate-semialdehyde dehydrogenase [Nitriliruptor alkaliphilus]
MAIAAVDPSTGETIATYEAHDGDAVEQRLARAWEGFLGWRGTTFDERGDLLRAAAGELESRRSDLAELMVREMGKTITAAEAEVDKCVKVCHYEADHGEANLAHDVIETEAARSYVRFDPLGPLLAVMPWNFPLWQVFRALAPATMAGNTVLLKHASNVPGTALVIEEIMRAAGAPEGVFTTLLVGSDAVEGIIADPRVRSVTITGSVGAGRKVGAAAGEHLKPSVLELGGSDPFIVLDDADVVTAARVARDSRLLNNGQSCISAKRFVVVDAVADDFVEAFVAAVGESVIGDPMDRDTTLGPLAREDLRDDLHGQVRATVDSGAELLTGGEAIDRPGFYYAPTVLDRVDPGMTAAREETFGPAATVLRVPDEDHAITVANDTDFGLGASIWTEDLERGERIAARIEAGCVFVNELVKSDPRVPFGGVKDAGYGRELGAYGIKSFVNAKTVWVEGRAADRD